MDRIPDKQILEEISKQPGRERLSFALENLIGETIAGTRVIDRQKGKKEHTYPGRYLQVVDFRSGTALAWYEEGHHDWTETHAYLLSPDGKVFYSHNLFDVDTRMRP